MVIDVGTTKVTMALIKNNKIIKGKPEKFRLLKMVAKEATMTLPIFVSLNKLINKEAKKIKTKVFPVPSRE